MPKLKHIGIAAITAEGAALCYKTILAEAAKILGPNQHPEISLHSFSFSKLLEAQHKKDWDTVGKYIVESINKLAVAGANFAVMPANATHYAFDYIQQNGSIPLLNLVSLTSEECKKLNFTKVGVLGVGVTMSGGLYRKPLTALGIEPITPDDEQQKIINDIIFQEIIPEKITESGIDKIIEIIKKLKIGGCDGVILGCTELPIIINKTNSPLPFIDTTRLLAKKALEFAM